jgi:lipoprotein-releasing system permease protein
LSFASFIAGRIILKSNRTFSKLIVRIAIVGIMLGLGVMILTVAIVRGFKREIREKVRGFAGDIQIVKYDNNYSFENSPIVIDTNFTNAAKMNKLITGLWPVATKPGIIKTRSEIEGVVLKGVDKNYDWSFFKKVLISGRVLSFRDTDEAKKEIMISSNTADRLRLKVGDKFLMFFVQEGLRGRAFHIVGIYDVGVEDVDKTFVIGDLSLIQRLNNWKPNEVGSYEVRTADFKQIDHANAFLNEILPSTLRSNTVSENYPNIFEWLKLLDVNVQVMLVLMTIVAVINMISALLIMILERTAMIGIFKAMGANNWTIQKVFLYNASYLVGIGLLLGNFFGLGISIFQNQTQFFKLDHASYYMTFVPIQINWTDVVLLNIGTMLTCMLVLVVPSLLVSKISPVRAIQYK